MLGERDYDHSYFYPKGLKVNSGEDYEKHAKFEVIELGETIVKINRTYEIHTKLHLGADIYFKFQCIVKIYQHYCCLLHPPNFFFLW